VKCFVCTVDVLGKTNHKVGSGVNL